MSTRKRPSPSSDDEYGPNQRQKTTKTARTTRGAIRKQKTAEELLSEPKNTVFDPKTDLLSLLSSPEARKAVEELRPDLVEHHRRLLNDTGLARRCIANFQRDGRSGFYDPEWQSQAREAFERHRNGDFDPYLKWRLYQDWPELEELDKSREKAAAEVHATRMAEVEKEEQDEEQHGFEAVPKEFPTSVEESNSFEAQNSDGFQDLSKVQTAVEAPDAVEEPKENDVQAPDEAQVEDEDSNTVDTQKEAAIEVSKPTEDSKTKEVQEEDGEGQAVNIQTPAEAHEPTQVPESSQQTDFPAPKESTERLPITPPREHSPDVQCITDSQEPHSSSPAPIVEDFPKPLPLTNEVPLESFPETTLISQ